MNTKSLLTRIGVPVLSLGLLGGLGATLATSASASTTQARGEITAVTHISHRYDNGGGGHWAVDRFDRTLTIDYLGKSTDPAHAAAPYEYTPRSPTRARSLTCPASSPPTRAATTPARSRGPTRLPAS